MPAGEATGNGTAPALQAAGHALAPIRPPRNGNDGWLLAVPLAQRPADSARSGYWLADPDRSDGPGSIVLRMEPRLVPAVRRAIDQWRRCDNYGVEFPGFAVGPETALAIEVRYQPDNESSNACARFDGGAVVVYEWARDAAGRPVRCRPLELALAHELGHVLGLRDERGPDICNDSIMSKICAANRATRRVQPVDCRNAAERSAVRRGVCGPADREVLRAEAFATRNGRSVTVGSNSDVRNLATAANEVHRRRGG